MHDLITSSIFNQPMPSTLELEQTVLGTMLIDSHAHKVCINIIDRRSFYNDSNRKIFDVILDLNNQNSVVDLMTVTESLKCKDYLKDIGGPFFLVELTNKVASSANLEYHCRILKQYSIRRKVIESSYNIMKAAFNLSEDIFNTLNRSEKELFNGLDQSYGKAVKIGEIGDDLIDKITKLDGQVVIGVPTGIECVDKLLGGYQKGKLVILAARPSMGKTMVSLNFAYNACRYFGKKILYFSCEQDKESILCLLLAMETGIKTDKIMRGDLTDIEWELIYDAKKIIVELPFFIDDTPNPSFTRIKIQSSIIKSNHDIDEIFIDYLQLINHQTASNQRREAVGEISRGLKSLARSLDIPVIALSQLSRSVETRGGDKRPQLSDLKESGDIEQDADVVSFLYRPSYYGIDSDGKGNSLKNLLEFITRKNRGGKIGTEFLKIELDKARIFDYDDAIYPKFVTEYNMALIHPTKNNKSLNKNLDLPFL